MIRRKAKHRINQIILKNNIDHVYRIIEILDVKSCNDDKENGQDDLIEDSNLCSKILTMPEKTYGEVQDKVSLIMKLKNKYVAEDEEEDISEWEKYEK